MTPPADTGFPCFFAEVPSVTLRDPLAQFLGAAEQGQITYRYEAPDPNGIMHTFEHTQFVTRNFFTLPGEPIAIIYLPTRPEISNIEGNRYLLIGDRMWATIILGLVEAFVGMLLILHIKEWSTHRKRHGSG